MFANVIVSEMKDRLYIDAVALLRELIKTQSYSREENKTADIIELFFKNKGKTPLRIKNNVCVKSHDFWSDKPTVLLNSHHDTVQATKKWSVDPFGAVVDGDRLIGLGSNDAGASLVSLIAAFLYLDTLPGRSYNMLFAASAEEEVSGTEGAELLMKEFGSEISFGIVGEPTNMEMAIAEKGLVVLDCATHGQAGHAARNEGVNAIYKALDDIMWFKSYSFPKKSEVLGSVKMTVSMINAGKQHNVVPDICTFVVDVRTNGMYTNQEIVDAIKKQVTCTVHARSLRLNSSSISLNHPLVQRGLQLNLPYYGSPTMSDQVFMNFPTLKMGPGDSARSHTADEYILLSEIRNGIDTYIAILEELDVQNA